MSHLARLEKRRLLTAPRPCKPARRLDRAQTRPILLFPGCRVTLKLWKLSWWLSGNPAALDGTWLGIPPPNLCGSLITARRFCVRQSQFLRGLIALCPCSWEAQSVSLRPACGAAVHQLGPESACRVMPPDCTLCLRKACAAVFALDTSAT